jgi:hypothetical protein
MITCIGLLCVGQPFANVVYEQHKGKLYLSSQPVFSPFAGTYLPGV